jgi:hypothetical protein
MHAKYKDVTYSFHAESSKGRVQGDMGATTLAEAVLPRQKGRSHVDAVRDLKYVREQTYVSAVEGRDSSTGFDFAVIRQT